MPNVCDTELTIYAGRCNLHAAVSKERPRLTDGVDHPVKIIKVGVKKGNGRK